MSLKETPLSTSDSADIRSQIASMTALLAEGRLTHAEVAAALRGLIEKAVPEDLEALSEHQRMLKFSGKILEALPKLQPRTSFRLDAIKDTRDQTRNAGETEDEALMSARWVVWAKRILEVVKTLATGMHPTISEKPVQELLRQLMTVAAVLDERGIFFDEEEGLTESYWFGTDEVLIPSVMVQSGGPKQISAALADKMEKPPTALKLKPIDGQKIGLTDEEVEALRMSDPALLMDDEHFNIRRTILLRKNIIDALNDPKNPLSWIHLIDQRDLIVGETERLEENANLAAVLAVARKKLDELGIEEVPLTVGERVERGVWDGTSNFLTDDKASAPWVVKIRERAWKRKDTPLNGRDLIFRPARISASGVSPSDYGWPSPSSKKA